jgi:hypothetical protein
MIEINKKLSIQDFIEIYDVTSKTDLNKLQKDLVILTMLSGKPIEYFRKLNHDETLDYIEQIQFVYNPLMANVTDEYTLLNGKKVKFLREFNKLTTGQMIDILDYKQNEKTEVDRLNNLGNILACICLPITKTKKGKEVVSEYMEGYDKVKLADEFMNYMSIEDANGISLFFSTFFGLVSTIFHACLGEEMKLKMISALKNLKLDKDGKIPMKMKLKLEKKIQEVLQNDGIGLQ